MSVILVARLSFAVSLRLRPVSLLRRPTLPHDCKHRDRDRDEVDKDHDHDHGQGKHL